MPDAICTPVLDEHAANRGGIGVAFIDFRKLIIASPGAATTPYCHFASRCLTTIAFPHRVARLFPPVPRRPG
jgi:hypothetical protein